MVAEPIKTDFRLTFLQATQMQNGWQGVHMLHLLEEATRRDELNCTRRCGCHGGKQSARAPHVEPKPGRCVDQSHDNAVAVGAAKYRSHEPTVDSRLADLSDDAAADACDFGNCHIECK